MMTYLCFKRIIFCREGRVIIGPVESALDTHLVVKLIKMMDTFSHHNFSGSYECIGWHLDLHYHL